MTSNDPLAWDPRWYRRWPRNRVGQSKVYDEEGHLFLVTVSEIAGFEPKFYRWMSILYLSLTAVVQVNGKCSESFAIERSVRRVDFCFLLLYVLALKRLLWRLRDKETSPIQSGIVVPDGARSKVSAYVDDVTVFVWRSEGGVCEVQKGVRSQN